jgi:ornithine cyclodeaminase/alanine dehydrogenase-like protein (mu-crystallin family)
MSRTVAAPTLILARVDVAALMDAGEWLEAVENGFAAAASGKASSPPPMAVDGRGGTFHAKGARIDLERRYVALKLNGNFPDNPGLRGLPTIQGALLLCDGETGSLLAIMDSIEVTLQRTAAATALAARFLARPDSRQILICGCGEQANAQLAALKAVLPLRSALAWDRDHDRSRAFAEEQSDDGFFVEPATDLAEASRASDVIVTCTTARSPFLEERFVRPGTFVAAVGADSHEKSEVQPALMRRALVVADILDQCATMGDLHHAIAAGVMDRGDVHAELSELVGGSKKGRCDDEQITLFDSTGTALQDVAAAALIYRRAIQAGAAKSIHLGAAV